MGKLENIKELIGSSDLVEQEMNSLRGGNAKELVAVCSVGTSGNIRCDLGKITAASGQLMAL